MSSLFVFPTQSDLRCPSSIVTKIRHKRYINGEEKGIERTRGGRVGERETQGEGEETRERKRQTEREGETERES